MASPFDFSEFKILIPVYIFRALLLYVALSMVAVHPWGLKVGIAAMIVALMTPSPKL